MSFDLTVGLESGDGLQLEGIEPELERAPKLADRVVALLGARLVSSPGGTLMPSEAELAKAFGVSRTVAREVVQTLARLGMVDVSQGKRMRVRPLEDWDYLSPIVLGFFDDVDVVKRILTELHELRVVMEPAVAERAARRATADQIAGLKAELDAMEAALDDPSTYVQHDVAFHALLAQASDNRFIRRVVETSRALLVVAQLETTIDDDILPISFEAHKRILEAIVARDPTDARAAMDDHLAVGSARFWLGRELSDSTTDPGMLRHDTKIAD